MLHSLQPLHDISSAWFRTSFVVAYYVACSFRAAHMTLVNWTQSYAEDRGMIRYVRARRCVRSG